MIVARHVRLAQRAAHGVECGPSTLRHPQSNLSRGLLGALLACASALSPEVREATCISRCLNDTRATLGHRSVKCRLLRELRHAHADSVARSPWCVNAEAARRLVGLC